MNKIVFFLFLSFLTLKSYGQQTIYDFNTSGDLTTYFTKGGTTSCISQSTNTGINGTGAINLTGGTCNEIFTTKESYTMAGVGSKFAFSCYLKSEFNSGYGGVGFSNSPNSVHWQYAAPNNGIGISVHGGGFEFTSGTNTQSNGWCISEFLNQASPSKWYKINLSIELKTNDTFEMIVKAYASNANGVLDSTKQCTHSWKVKNTTLATSNVLYSYFGFGGQRVTNFDNYEINLSGGSSVIQPGNPILTGSASIIDTTITLNGSISSDNGSPVSERGFVYSQSSNPTTNNTKITKGTGTGSFNHILTSLSPGKYFFRAYATNSIGTSYSSEYEIVVPITDHFWNGSNSNAWNNNQNWDNNNPPKNGDNVIFNSNASRDLIYDTSWKINILNFNNSNKKIVVSDYDLDIDSFINFNDNSFAKTIGSGKIITKVNHLKQKTFPIGNDFYNPIKITNNSGLDDTFSVRIIDSVMYNGLSGSGMLDASVLATWDVSKKKVNSGSGINFEFTWNTLQEKTGVSNYVLNHHNGANWEIASGTNSVATNGNYKTAIHSNYTGGFSPFAFGSNTMFALPVEFIGMKGDCSINEDKIILNWQTASELNASHYDILKSENGIDWDKIGEQKANGTTSSISRYKFEDINHISKKQLYYRLKQYDIEGVYEYLPIISVNCNLFDFNPSLFPNPTNSFTYLKIYSKEEEKIQINIYNILGVNIYKQLHDSKVGENKIVIDLSKYSVGSYLVEVLKNKVPLFRSTVLKINNN